MPASRPGARLRAIATIIATAATIIATAATIIATAAAVVTVTAVFAAPVFGATVAAAPAKGILPPKNPARDVSPSPDFFAARSCAGGGDSATCNAIVVRAITHARAVLEKIGGMSFSLSAYEKLTPDEQLFVTANLERVERGLPAIAVLTKSLDKVAQEGANADTDPPLNKVPGTLPGGGRWVSLGGNWAGGYDNALGADYGWMYNDKPERWGHRDNVLGRYVTASSCGGASHEIAMGAGHVTKGKAYGDSETELFAGICGHTPTDIVLTWAQAKKLLHITRPAGITGLTMPGRLWGQMRQRPRSTGPDAPTAPLPDGFPAVTFQRCAPEPGSLVLNPRPV